MGAINSITNANLYIGANSFLGKVKELTLPEGAAKMVEHSALGQIGMIDLPAGFEKFEAKITWNSFYADALVQTGSIFDFLTMQARSSVKVYGANGLQQEVPLVVTMRGSSKNLPAGSFKQNENVEAETNLNVTYFKLSIDGKDVYEVDPVNNIYKVNGVDKLATYRANIGQ